MDIRAMEGFTRELEDFLSTISDKTLTVLSSTNWSYYKECKQRSVDLVTWRPDSNDFRNEKLTVQIRRNIRWIIFQFIHRCFMIISIIITYTCYQKKMFKFRLKSVINVNHIINYGRITYNKVSIIS